MRNNSQGELIISSVLIFVQMSFNRGNNDDDIICYGLDILDSAGNFIAKCNFWNKIYRMNWSLSNTN